MDHERDFFDSLVEWGIIWRGHFELTAGDLHTGAYMAKGVLDNDPRLVAHVAIQLARTCVEYRVDVVLSAAIGGIKIGHELAKALGYHAAPYARKNAAGHLELHEYQLGGLRGKRVLLADNVTSTASTLAQLAALVRAAQGEVVGAAVVWDRRTQKIPILGIPEVRSLTRRVMPIWHAPCPLCEQDKPLDAKPP